MLYIFDEVDKLSGNFHIRYAPYLSQERIEKIGRLKSASSKELSAVVYLLLRYALVAQYGIDEQVIFEYGKNEKPCLRSYPEIHFNLSHTANAVACVVSGSPIGVDIQRITTVSDKVARRVLADGEYTEYLKSDSPDEFFCRVWAIKESVLKQTGQGISAEFKDIIADELVDITLYRGDGYYCCVTESDSIVKKVGFETLELFLLR
ncbi:MAG: 4'-phosphopantetheinyl transferase superfamily protein [Oscillospiraceae bacterium]|nr:4'-phosphopantetheinyl transferase superfamily protein [Oscillospiraceae bacterium]